MKRARELKRVSWAPQSKLCQAILFSSQDCPHEVSLKSPHDQVKTLSMVPSTKTFPSKVGKKSECHIQAKTSSLVSSTGIDEDVFPPGFGCYRSQNQSNVELSHIPMIKWKCPPSFAISNEWGVAIGEESREKISQKRRELKVLEAIYPRPSSIPPSPFVSLEVKKECVDDTGLISIIPTEEIAEDAPTNLQQHIPPPAIEISIEQRIIIAATIIAALVKINEHGRHHIDLDLLFNGLLNNASFIENLIHQCRTAVAIISASVSRHTSASAPLLPNTTLPSVSLNRQASNMYMPAAANKMGFNNVVAMSHPPSARKLCKFFNSSRGCRNGSNCSFQHDTSTWSEWNAGRVMLAPSGGKRLKVGPETTWRM